MNETTGPKEHIALFTGSTPNLDNARVAFFLAKMAAQSGLFPDLTPPIALMKFAMARELDITIYEALSDIQFVEGRAELSAALMAKLMLRGGRYTYRVRTNTNERADIDFYRIHGDKLEFLGTSSFTIEDAARAGLTGKRNWVTYPRMMCFWRAMSQGISVYCPDAIDGRFYVAGEISDGISLNTPMPANAKVISIDVATPAPQIDPPAQLGEAPAVDAASKPVQPAAPTNINEKKARRVNTKLKDTDPVADSQRETWTKLHTDFEIPETWDKQNLGGQEFSNLTVGAARQVLIELQRYVRDLPKRKIA